MQEFRNVTLKCLSEIAGLNIGPEYNGKFTTLFQVVMTCINRMVPPSTGKVSPKMSLTSDIKAAYASADDEDQQLINNLALFLTNYLNHHLRLIENPENKDLLINAHLYLIKISTVDDREIFKICLEYWGKVSRVLTSLTIACRGTVRGDTVATYGRHQPAHESEPRRHEWCFGIGFERCTAAKE